MSLLFTPGRTQHIAVPLPPDATEHLDDLKTLRIGGKLWDALLGNSLSDASPPVERIAVAVRPHRISRRRGENDMDLTCWAALDPTLPSNTFTSPDNLSRKLSTLPSHDGSISYTMSRTYPPTLTEVFFHALTDAAYDFANGLPARMDSEIARQGDLVSLKEDGKPYRYKILMTEPVLQGLIKSGTTRFTVIPPSPQGDEEEEEKPVVEEEVNTFDLVEDSVSDSGVDIDENFLLAGTALLLPPMSPVGGEDERSSPGLHSESQWEGNSGSFSLRALPEPAANIGDEEDDEAMIYVRPKELGRIGVFSGDWVVVRGNGKQRLAKVVSDESHDAPSYTAFTSPVLAFNLSPSPPFTIQIHPTPFSVIPTASSATIARIASPYSTDKRLQSLFLRGLKTYFHTKRLVKEGDIIAVKVWVEQADLLPSEEDQDEADTVLEYDFPLASQAPSAVVVFKITNLEYDVIRSSSAAPDAASIGELGCRIDPTSTKMIQTGLEHSRIPDLTAYYGINTGFASSSAKLTAEGTPFAKLHDVIEAVLYPSAVEYDLPISVLLKGSRGIGKQTVVRWVARKLGVHVYEINCFDVVGETDVKTEGTLKARFERAAECAPCIFLLRHVEALARTGQTLETGREPPIIPVLHDCLDELRKAWRTSGFPVILVATTSDAEHVPIGVLGCFKHEIAFEVPNEPERLAILEILLSQAPLAPDTSLPSIATQTAALVAADLVDLVERTKMASMERALKATAGSAQADVLAAGIQLTGADFDVALSKARASYSESIGAPTIPNVSWDDVGGLANVKQDILDTIQLPLEHPELFADGVKKRSGILLYGPPGTGKTLLAKAVATSCSLNFFSVKGPELLNMYIGESEANVRRVFQRARDAKPCVIFFDELDSVAPKRGNHGDSGGVMDRIVSQLLAELDGMADGNGGADVFVIGATNRPDLLDAALLRPGRFDRMLYLGVSDNHDAQLKIMQALTRKFRLDPSLNLRDIAEQCPFNYTGADFYALCSDAMLKSMSRKAQEIDTTIAELNKKPPPYQHPHPITPQYYLAEMATDAETDVLVSRVDFDAALRELVPSVSASEMQHYAEVQRKFSKDTINSTVAEEDDNEPQTKRNKGKGKAM